MKQSQNTLKNRRVFKNFLSASLHSALSSGVKWVFSSTFAGSRELWQEGDSDKAESHHKLLFFKIKIVSLKPLPCSNYAIYKTSCCVSPQLQKP